MKTAVIALLAACVAVGLSTPVRNKRAAVFDKEWGKWSVCSKSCGHGRQWRTLGCTESTTGQYSDSCANQTASCNMQHCADIYGFSDWTTCSAKCNGGKRSRSATKMTKTEEIDCHTQDCTDVKGCGGADLYFVWDSSGSISEVNFYRLKQFTIDVLKSLPMGNNETEVGLIQYATEVKVEWKLGNQPSNLETGLWNVKWMAGSTNTADALAELKKRYEVGYNRPGHKDIAIVITDGVSNIIKQNTIPNAEALHQIGVEVFAIGIGSIDDAELTGIASKPTSSHKFVVSDFDSLNQITKAIVNGTCEAASRVDCDAWNAWGACSKSCGKGKQTRTQTCRMVDGMGNKGPDVNVLDQQDCDAGTCVVDHCASTPCLNGATCKNEQNGYVCTCAAGYTGLSCETGLLDCANCKRGSDGVGYLPNINNCATYIQCERKPDGTYKQHIMGCPSGLYWNQDILNCVGAPPFNYNCKFVDVTTGPPTTRITTNAVCAFKSVAGEPNAFISGNTKMMCAPGTSYDATRCSCVFDMNAVPLVNKCDELYYLPFDKDVQDQSCTHAWVGSYFAQGWSNVNENIVKDIKECVKGGCMYFDGKTRLDIAHMRNRWNNKNQREFSVSVWVKRTVGSHLAGVVNNGDCVDTPSFTLRASAAATYVGGFDTMDTKDLKETQPISGMKADTWHHIALVYNGAQMRTYLDGTETDSKSLSGGLENRFCPLNIGHTGKIDFDWATNTPLGFFQGYMDELRVYERALSVKEVDTLFSKP